MNKTQTKKTKTAITLESLSERIDNLRYQIDCVEDEAACSCSVEDLKRRVRKLEEASGK